MQEHCRRNELTDVCEIMGKVARVRPHIERNSVEDRLVYKLVLYFLGRSIIPQLHALVYAHIQRTMPFKACCSVVSRVNVMKDIQDSRASPSHS